MPIDASIAHPLFCILNIYTCTHTYVNIYIYQISLIIQPIMIINEFFAQFQVGPYIWSPDRWVLAAKAWASQRDVRGTSPGMFGRTLSGKQPSDLQQFKRRNVKKMLRNPITYKYPPWELMVAGIWSNAWKQKLHGSHFFSPNFWSNGSYTILYYTYILSEKDLTPPIIPQTLPQKVRLDP